MEKAKPILLFIIRQLNNLFSLKIFVVIYFAFWSYYHVYPFVFEDVKSPFIITAFYYLPIALFFILFKSIRKISRFYSIPLGFIGVVAAPIAFLFTSPDANARAQTAEFYRYFFSFTLPVALATLLNIIISIPAYFRLIYKKPQYFLFSFMVLISTVYVLAVEYRFYIQHNGYDKFFCSYQDTKEKISPKVVRIIGSFSEGSGFFISPTRVATNKHVVEGEDYPKIVLPTGEFITPISVDLSPIYDLAYLTISNPHPDFVVEYKLDDKNTILKPGEEVLSFGYADGSDIKGDATVIPIRYENDRKISKNYEEYLQFSSPIVSGMSGGPVFDKCGSFVGVNTMGTTGTSLIISNETFRMSSDIELYEKPKKRKLEPGATPKDSVYAYYYLLKARDTQGCYDLLSASYKTKSTYTEWTARFPNVIGVEVFKVEEIKPNLVYVLFGMAEWVNGEQIRKTYEGTWETVKVGDSYFLNKSYILEIESIYSSKGPDFYKNPEGKR